MSIQDEVDRLIDERPGRELLHPDRAVIVLTGPAERLVPQVEDLGPVEVVEP